MNNAVNNPSNDMFYTIDSLLKRDGYFVFSNDDLRSQEDAGIPQEGQNRPVPAAQFKAFEEIQDSNKSAEIFLEQIQKSRPEFYKPIQKSPKQIDDTLQFDIPTIISSLQWHMNRISRNVIGRDEIIEQLMYATLTGEHLLLLSRTGMAKSFLVNELFNSFENTRVFSAQASKDQTPDNYFGPYDIEEFKRGIIRHNIKGSIIEANLVLLDEFFDASDVVLRSLLSVLNERKFINGSEQIDVAIHTAVATANYLRLNEVTEAVLDRFIYKAIIPEDDDMYNRLLIDQSYSVRKGKPEEPLNRIPFEQIVYLHNIIVNNNKKIQIVYPDQIKFMKNVIISKFVSEVRRTEPEFFISPRKQAKISDFLRASALLDNRFEVTNQDLKNMYICLVTLNRSIQVKQKDKLFKEIFLDIYQQTMNHFTATNSFQQIDFLLNSKNIFQMLRDDPQKKEKMHDEKGLLQNMKNILAKLFFAKPKDDEQTITIDSLKQNIMELNPSVEEVRELKQGILRDYKDVY
jgi:MoxR-like ATPase